MLTYAFTELRQNNYEDIKGEFFHNIYDLFSEILFKAISHQLKKGLHKEYVAHKENMPTIKGKIDLNTTISLYLQRKLLVGCEFDDFSVDNLYNQILKSVLLLLVNNKEVNPDRQHNLRKLLLFFSEVSECNLKTIRWNDIKYDKNSSTYHLLHNFCYFITKGLLLTNESGSYSLQHFHEELMSRLFEKFVLNYYRKHYPQYIVKAAKVTWDIDETYSSLWLLPEMQTDITILFPNHTLIIDTKYYGKALQVNMGKATIRNSNLYQINSYIFHEDKTHSGLVDGMLLYAKTEEEIQPEGEILLRNGNRIFFRNLDLNQDFSKIKKQLDGFIASYL